MTVIRDGKDVTFGNHGKTGLNAVPLAKPAYEQLRADGSNYWKASPVERLAWNRAVGRHNGMVEHAKVAATVDRPSNLRDLSSVAQRTWELQNRNRT